MTAERTIGNLESVPIRKVWADEAHDLTALAGGEHGSSE